MKLFYKREVRGAIAILMVAILLPMMVMSALLVDTARYNLSRAMVSSAADLAMNAALADYDTIVKEVYGLFAMSQADDVEKNVKNYFEQTVVSYGVVGREDAGSYVESLLGSIYSYLVLEEKDTANFLAMTVGEDDVKVGKVEGSELANPSVLEKQIVEYMKYRAPVEFGLSFLDALPAFTKVEAQSTVIEAQMTAQESMEPVADANGKTYDAAIAYDRRYRELEPDPPTNPRFHLTNYGNILLNEYGKEYRELHELTMTFATAAYRQGWNLPGVASDDMLVLNEAGDYIVYSDPATPVVSRHFCGENCDTAHYGDLKDDMDNYLNNSNNNVKAVLSGYGTRKFADSSPLDMSQAANRAAIIPQFQSMDLFYKTQYKTGDMSWLSMARELDRFAVRYERYCVVTNEMLAKYDRDIATAETNQTSKVAEISRLTTQIDDAKRIRASFSAEDRKKAEDFRANEAKIAEYEEMKSRAGAEEKENLQALIELLKAQNDAIKASVDNWDTLYGCYSTIDNKEAQKNECQTEVGKLQGDVDVYKGKKQELDNEIKEYKRKYTQALSDCMNGLNNYNADAKMYRAYIVAIEQYVNGRAHAISTEFQQIYDNIVSLRDLLKALSECLIESENNIINYANNVNAWKNANSAYDSGNGGADTFSETNKADIRTAENTFDVEDVKKLQEIVTEQYNKVVQCILQIDMNFDYMTRDRKIKNIISAQEIHDIIKASGVYGQITEKYDNSIQQGKVFPSSDECQAFFSLTDSIDAGFLDEMKTLNDPVPCCKFMNYLHQTYHVEAGEATEGENNESVPKIKSKDQFKEFKDKDFSKNASQKADEESEEPGGSEKEKYGYNYMDTDSLSGEELPSAVYANYSKTGEAAANSGKNSRDGLSANKQAANSVLSGLGQAIEKGRDKLYVTAYLFENFSYNTVVQDQARKYLLENGKTQPSWNHCGDSLYKDDKSSKIFEVSTCGDIPINAMNNKIYGAEIEYILYGNPKPSANVGYAKASIFAIRALFNTIYAFTSSDIRNETRSVALAVQAATGGWVPYQVVQVVMQIALALGESALDLKSMEAGAKIAIVKTKETWTLSMSGLTNLAKETGHMLVGDAADAALNAVQGKIAEIIDATANELEKKVDNISGDLTNCVNSAAGEVVDAAFANAESLIDQYLEEAVNNLFYTTGTNLSDELTNAKIQVQNTLRSTVDALKSNIKNNVLEPIKSDNAGNIVIGTCCDEAGKLIDQQLEQAYNDILLEMSKAETNYSLQTIVYRELYKVKGKISNAITQKTSAIIGAGTAKVKGEISRLQTQIKNEAANVTEDCVEEIRGNISNQMNGFIDKYIPANNVSMKVSGSGLDNANSNAVDSSSKAAAVTFGYSDYLKLFVFIGLCASDKSGSLLARTADVIQLNITSAQSGSPLCHRMGSSFRMKNAKTYVSLEADVELDMMFLNLGVFQKQVDVWNEDYEDEYKVDLGEKMAVHYLGISGY